MTLKIKQILFFIWMVFSRKKKKETTQMAAPQEGRNHPSFYTSSRRIKKIHIYPEQLMNVMMSGGMVGVVNGILPGSKFAGFGVNERENAVYFYIEHPMFDSVPRGTEIPAHGTIEIKDLREKLLKEMEDERARI